jgi:hypothetical protein
MKRTPVIFVLACAAISLSMFSCDAMFEGNVFGGMTHKKLSAGSLQDKSPVELKEIFDSDYNLKQLAEDPELKEGVLDQLEEEYLDKGPGTGTETAEGQLAAILAGDIIIGTDPAASQLAAGALGAIQTMQDLQDISNPTEDDIRNTFTDIMNDILPLDIKNAIGVETAPPQSFVDMIAAFAAADDAYSALNAGLGPDGTYLADVTDEEKVGIAFNALVAGLIGIVVPLDDANNDGIFTPIADPTSEQVALALWTAISNPESAMDAIRITDTAYDDLLGESGIGNILKGLPFDFSSMA